MLTAVLLAGVLLLGLRLAAAPVFAALARRRGRREMVVAVAAVAEIHRVVELKRAA